MNGAGDGLRRPPSRRAIGDIIDSTFQYYFKDFSFVLTATVYILAPFLILQMVFDRASFTQLHSLLTQLSQIHTVNQLATLHPTTVAGSAAVSIVVSLLQALLVSPLLFGTLLYLVVGVSFQAWRPSVQDAFSHAFRRIPAVVITLLLLMVLVFFAVVIITLFWLLVMLAFAHGATFTPSPALVVLAVILSLVVLILSVYFSVKLSLVSAVVLAEGLQLWAAIRRSFQLTHRHFWRAFVYFILIFLITGAVRGVLDIAANLLIHSGVVAMVITNIVTLFTLPFTLLATATLYVDLRSRSDGMELQSDAGGGR